MLKKQTKNLLPKKTKKRDSIKFSLNIFKIVKTWNQKWPKFGKLGSLAKLSLVPLFLLYFAGYQPTLAIPPVKKTVAQASELTQEQSITAYYIQQPFQLPHPGYISNYYSRWHTAVDIATGLGMPIHPVTTGVVSEVNYGYWGYGNYVAITHEQGFHSMYAHMGRIYVKVGDSVDLNSILGEVGMTGRTTGPHTHLEITKDGKFIDPRLVLPTAPDLKAHLQASRR